MGTLEADLFLILVVICTCLSVWLLSKTLLRRYRCHRVVKQALINYAIDGGDSSVALVGLTNLDQRHAFAEKVYNLAIADQSARALTLISRAANRVLMPETKALELRLRLKLGLLESARCNVESMKQMPGLERLIFATLILCARWKEAVSFYEMRVLKICGSQREHALLLSLRQFFRPTTHLNLLTEEDTRAPEQAFWISNVNDKNGAVCRHLDDIRLGLDSGVRTVEEMTCFLEILKKLKKDESATDLLHHNSRYDVRVNWRGVQLLLANHELNGFCGHKRYALEILEQAKSDARSQAGYECQVCGAARRGFGIICAHCLSIDLGLPVALGAERLPAAALSASGVDFRSMEDQYWHALLRSS